MSQAMSDAAPRKMGSAGRGAAWTFGTFLASNVLRLGSNLILTRLLYPEAFGLLSLVMAFITGLALLSDVGINISLVQHPRAEEPRFRDTAWTVQVMRGGLMWMVCCAVGWPVAQFYGQPQLLWLLPLVGFSAFIGGFDSTSLYIAQRNLQIKRTALLELGTGLVGSVATIAAALAHRELYGANHPDAVIAMAVGICTGNLVKTALSHVVLPFRHRHRFLLARDVVKDMSRIGGWLLLSSGLTFLVGQLDRLTFAKMIPLDLFGVYGIAAMLASIPVLAMGGMSRNIGTPVLSRVVHAKGDLPREAARIRRPLLIVSATLMAGLMACGPLLISIIYDARYQEAGWILQLLTLSLWVSLPECFNGTVLLAQQRPRWLALANGVKLGALAVALPVGFHLGGFRGALVGLIAVEALKYAVSELAVRRTGVRSFGVDALFTLLLLATAGAGKLAGDYVLGAGYGNVPAFFAAGLTTALCWAVIGGQYLLEQRARKRAAPPHLNIAA